MIFQFMRKYYSELFEFELPINNKQKKKRILLPFLQRKKAQTILTLFAFAFNLI
jgi:hypothetical protein